MTVLLTAILVSACLGALVGLIRQWGDQQGAEPGEFAGVRTHTLWAVLGCLAAHLNGTFPYALAVVLVAVPARPAPPRPRPGSSLPTGPDPAKVFLYAKWGAISVATLIVLFLIKGIFFSSSPEPAKRPATAPAAPKGPQLGLVATGAVQVTLRRKNADETEGEIVYTGFLAAGESRSVPRPGALFVEASMAEILELEINGKRYNLGQMLGNGPRRGQLPAP